jgi:hypothetical protein
MRKRRKDERETVRKGMNRTKADGEKRKSSG